MSLAFLMLWICAQPLPTSAPVRPNIVLILCDDLGYGDVSCLNSKGKIPTPQMDMIAREGMVFTDAHSGSAVCSPTRYGLLCGRYAWRGKLKSGVLGGLSPGLIEPGRLTIAQLLKDKGYQTAAIGKWHVGMDWEKLPGKKVTELGIESPGQNRNVDYTKAIKNGPNSAGFDYFFGISASLDMVPYAYIENDRLKEQPTGEAEFAMMLGKNKGKTRKGPASPGFDAARVLPDLTGKAVEYIGSRSRDAPFFLYLPLASPHTPVLPTGPFQGKSGLNPYADFVMETDEAIGKVASAVEKAGFADNTLFLVTSDNGCSPMADLPALLAKGHNPNYHFRGHKADIFEGGHRVPFLVRWPGKIAKGKSSDRLVCLTDLMSTFAEITGSSLPDNAAEDSFSFADLFGLIHPTEKRERPRRESIVHHSINGSFAIRRGSWKLCLCPDSGGWSAPLPRSAIAKKLPPTQLFDLSRDIGEKSNLFGEDPAKVTALEKELGEIVANGRSRPGPRQPNWESVNLRP